MPIFPNKIVPPPPGKGICPYLGIAEDPQTCLAYPSEWNLCQCARPAGRVSLEHQRTTCLLPGHTACPVFLDGAGAPLPAHLRGKRTWFEQRRIVLLVILLLLLGLLAIWWLYFRFA